MCGHLVAKYSIIPDSSRSTWKCNQVMLCNCAVDQQAEYYRCPTYGVEELSDECGHQQQFMQPEYLHCMTVATHSQIAQRLKRTITPWLLLGYTRTI